MFVTLYKYDFIVRITKNLMVSIMRDNEIIELTEELHKNIVKICEKKNSRNDILGRIGEEFVKTAIISSMRRMKFRFTTKNEILTSRGFKLLQSPGYSNKPRHHVSLP